MNDKAVTRFLVLAVFLSLSMHANAATKVVGTCSVKIDGAHALSYTGKLYEGDTPPGAVASVASSRAWMRETAAEYRKVSPTLGDQYARMADELIVVLMISCVSEKGRLGLQPYDGSAKPADYPSGPKTYRLVGDRTRDKKSGDMQAVMMVAGEGLIVLVPTELGELKVTQNDADRLVATFSFKSGESLVSGTIDSRRAKAVPN